MRRRLEFPFYLSVGVGMALSCSSFMMVAGLFQLTTLPWVLLALAIGGVFCTLLAFSIGELASMYPSSPAIVTYFKAAFGASTALVFVYLYLIFIVLIAGVESYLFALVMREIVPGLPPLAIVVALIVCVVTVNLLGLEIPRGIQMVLVFAAALLIVAMGVLGAVDDAHGTRAALDVGELDAGLVNLPAAIGLAVFLFMGFEWITPVGQRPGAYARMIPLAMPLAILVLAVAYAFFSVGLGATVPRTSLEDELTPQLPYFESLLGQSGTYLAAVLSLSAILSTFNAGIMSASRLVFAVAREGHLPRFCAKIRLETGAPVGAVLLLGGLGMASAFVVVGLGVELLAAVVGAAIVCLVYAGYMTAAIRLRRVDPERLRPFRTPLALRSQRVVIGLLIAIAVATLFSLPGKWPEATAATAVALLLACGLGYWSVRRSGQPAGARRPAAAARSS